MPLVEVGPASSAAMFSDSAPDAPLLPGILGALLEAFQAREAVQELYDIAEAEAQDLYPDPTYSFYSEQNQRIDNIVADSFSADEVELATSRKLKQADIVALPSGKGSGELAPGGTQQQLDPQIPRGLPSQVRFCFLSVLSRFCINPPFQLEQQQSGDVNTRWVHVHPKAGGGSEVVVGSRFLPLVVVDNQPGGDGQGDDVLPHSDVAVNVITITFRPSVRSGP